MLTLNALRSWYSHSWLWRLVRPPAMRTLIRQVVRFDFIERYNALELFARGGDWHTLEYRKYVRTLDLWEIDPNFEKALRKRFPNDSVMITDSFQEVQRTPKKFDLVISDNPQAIFGDQKFCEHFELFPHVFRILQNKSILVLNVIPSVSAKYQKRFPYLLNDEHSQRRSAFYKTNSPKSIPIEHMLRIYGELASQNGFVVQKHLVFRRTFVCYLVLFLSRESV